MLPARTSFPEIKKKKQNKTGPVCLYSNTVMEMEKKIVACMKSVHEKAACIKKKKNISKECIIKLFHLNYYKSQHLL